MRLMDNVSKIISQSEQTNKQDEKIKFIRELLRAKTLRIFCHLKKAWNLVDPVVSSIGIFS